MISLKRLIIYSEKFSARELAPFTIFFLKKITFFIFLSFEFTLSLSFEFNKLMKEPVEGFQISLKNEDLYSWHVAIFGPPKTLYEGGYFKAEMTFPRDYPYRKSCIESVFFLKDIFYEII